MNKKAIPLLLIGLGIVLLVGMVAAAFMGDLEVLFDNGEIKVVCSGTVEVDFLGIGHPELDPPPTCRIEDCGWFESLMSLASSEGQVKLYIDGTLKDTTGYKSYSGENKEFTLKSSCVNNPQNAEIVLYEDNIERDRYEVNLQ